MTDIKDPVEVVENKPFWASKTIWANLLTFAALFLQSHLGLSLDATEQTAIIAVVNLVMRFLSKGKVTLS